MEENNVTVVEETTANEVTTNEVTTDVTEEKSLGQELLEWIVLAFIVGVIWQGISLAIKGIKKLFGKIKKKLADKKAAKQQQAPVATVQEANQEGIVVGDSAEQQ